MTMKNFFLISALLTAFHPVFAGDCPFCRAAASGNMAAVKDFAQKSSLEVTDDLGRTPLMNALANYQFDVAKYLVDKGANLNAKSSLEEVAIEMTINPNCVPIIPFMIQYTENIVYLDKIINFAKSNNYTQIAKLAQDRKSDLQAGTGQAKTIQPGQQERDEKKPGYGKSRQALLTASAKLLWLANARINNGESNMKDIKKQLDTGAAPDVKDKDGNSVLMLAVKAKDAELVTLLTQYSCDINLRNAKGESPYSYAANKAAMNANNGYPQILNLLKHK